MAGERSFGTSLSLKAEYIGFSAVIGENPDYIRSPATGFPLLVRVEEPCHICLTQAGVQAKTETSYDKTEQFLRAPGHSLRVAHFDIENIRIYGIPSDSKSWTRGDCHAPPVRRYQV